MAQDDIRLEQVTKRFGDVVAVDDLSLEIERGRFFSLLGPSGCGKTTTLRMIGGFEEPSAGRIWIGDEDVTDRPPYRREVNTVFQNYALFPHLDVFENVAFGLRRRGVPSSNVAGQVREMLRLVQLPGYERRKPAQLSGGQQQRVALARALINRPRVLLLDEPLGALDLKLRRQMQLELKRIQNDVGITFVYVTHDQDEAMTMSDRIAVMNAGRIEQLGRPDELYETPRTAFVAGFLGVSNLIDARLASREREFAAITLRDGTPVRVPAAALDALEAATDVLRVGIRPEKLRLAPLDDAGSAGGRANGVNALEATVVDASYVGVSTQYVVETRDGQRLTVYEQNLETSGSGQALAGGQRVCLTWQPQHTFVIGGTTE